MSSQSDDSRVSPPAGPPAVPRAVEADQGVRIPLEHVPGEHDLLDRYLLGAVRPDEAEAARRFFGHPGRVSLLGQFKTWLERDADAIAPDTAVTFAELWQRVRAVEHGGGEHRPHSEKMDLPKQRRGWSAERKGAGIQTVLLRTTAFALAGAIVLMVLMRSTFAPQALPPLTGRTYATEVGERAVVILSDGSRVTLAPQSRLVVGNDFGRTKRDVGLTGEAYFDIQHTGHAPFVVHTGKVMTRVLGTSFDVRYYAEDRAAQVAVFSGKVAVGTRAAPRIISAGYVARITDSTITTTAVEGIGDYASWTTGRLVFTDVPIPAMLTTVGRWIGYEFRLADSTLTTRHVTAVFPISDRAETLQLLKDVLDVTMSFDTSIVTLHPRTEQTNQRAPTKSGMRDSFLPHKEHGK